MVWVVAAVLTLRIPLRQRLSVLLSLAPQLAEDLLVGELGVHGDVAIIAYFEEINELLGVHRRL